jgi:2'-5' RNA ligase
MNQLETKRIFIALPLSLKTKEKIIRWQKRNSHFPVRYIPAENLHITIIPPWYESNIQLVEEKLKTLENQFGPIFIHLEKITLGPNFKNPRLIWIEGNTPFELLNLKASLEKTLNLEPEKRFFKTHITIARFSSYQSFNFPFKKLNEKINWEEKINNFVLMESKLLKTGAQYKILKDIIL